MQQEKHSFAFGEASVLSRAHDKMARLVLESWSSVGTINRAIDLHPAYQALRTRLQSVQTGPTVLASESRLLQQLSPSQQGEGASRRSHDERETSPHRRAQTAERDSHMQRQLIGPSDYEDLASRQLRCYYKANTMKRRVVEVVLQRLESLVFQHHKPKFWARYVDDTFVVIERDQVLAFKEHLNAVFPEIEFTMEEEENNQLAFLDVLLSLKRDQFTVCTRSLMVLIHSRRKLNGLKKNPKSQEVTGCNGKLTYQNLREQQGWFDDSDVAISTLLGEKKRLHKTSAIYDNKAEFYRSRRLLQQRLQEI
nr:unnamed protein product [Spirometra erinaceieuropaei]